MLYEVITGIVYTAGAGGYALKGIRWTHPVWHLFVPAYAEWLEGLMRAKTPAQKLGVFTRFP